MKVFGMPSALNDSFITRTPAFQSSSPMMPSIRLAVKLPLCIIVSVMILVVSMPGG